MSPTAKREVIEEDFTKWYKRVMRKSRAMLAVLALAVSASAAPLSWVRRLIPGSVFTVEYPSGPGVEISEQAWRDKNGGPGVHQYKEIHLMPNQKMGVALDGITAGYDSLWRKKDFVEYGAEAWGEPTFLAPKRTKIGDYVATESGWRFEFEGRTKIQLMYSIEIGEGRYVEVSLNCFEEAFKRYEPLYKHMRDSIRLPAKPKPKA